MRRAGPRMVMGKKKPHPEGVRLELVVVVKPLGLNARLALGLGDRDLEEVRMMDDAVLNHPL